MRSKMMVRVFALLLMALWAMPVWAGEVYKLYVDGLACPFCAYGVEKKVGGLDGVERVDIDIDEGLVAVTMAEGSTLAEAAARRAVDEAGFTLRTFEAAKTE